MLIYLLRFNSFDNKLDLICIYKVCAKNYIIYEIKYINISIILMTY